MRLSTFIVIGLWVVGGGRLVWTLREGWRRSGTLLVAAELCATFVLTLLMFRSRIDGLLGHPNLSGLIGRIVTIVGLLAAEWATASRDRISRMVTGASAVGVSLVMVWAWSAAHLGPSTITQFSTVTHANVAALIYSSLFYLVIAAASLRIGLGSWRQRRLCKDRHDLVGVVVLSLLVSGWSALATTMIMFEIDSLVPGVPMLIRTIGNGILIASVLLLVAGMLGFPVVRWVWCQVAIWRMTPLWRRAVSESPTVVLSVGRAARILHPEIVYTRQLIEIEDATRGQ